MKDKTKDLVCDFAGYSLLGLCGAIVGEGYKRHSLGIITVGATAAVFMSNIMGQLAAIRSNRRVLQIANDTINCQSKVIEEMGGQQL